MVEPLPSHRHVKDFLAVLETGSFSAAARALGKAQPAVSYSVQELEEALGLTLLDRSVRPLRPTEAGTALSGQMRRLLDEWRQIRDRADMIRSGAEVDLSLVVDTMFPIESLTQLAGDFACAFPAVSLRITVEPFHGPLNRLVDGSCALAITGPMVRQLPDIVAFPIAAVDLIWVAASHHPLAARAGMVPADVFRNHVQIVLRSHDGPPAGLTDEQTGQKRWWTSDLGAKSAMIAAGLGWGSLPRHMAVPAIEQKSLAALLMEGDEEDGPPPLELFVAYRAGTPLRPTAAWLVRYLRSSLQDRQRSRS